MNLMTLMRQFQVRLMMAQMGEETEGGKSGTKPDFEHRGGKLNVSLSNFIMFINIIILYLQIQSKITLQYIN